MTNKPNIQLATTDICTGCAACANVCPKICISMVEDREGFLQPKIDTKVCIGCHKCEKTCPILNKETIHDDFETKTYAVINPDEEIRMQSSSGGVFYALAKWVIEQGGVVFGARWDENWMVMHDYAEDMDGVKTFMQSKYVQSRVGETYKQTKDFLKQGRWVLYTGTPCQLVGLRAYLGSEQAKLLQVDIFCHGVPSALVWNKYRASVTKDSSSLSKVAFRDKSYGGWWKNACMSYRVTDEGGESSVQYEPVKSNIYLEGFTRGVYWRQSCYECWYRDIENVADIRLGDCWHCEVTCPELNDEKGLSTVIVNSKKGNEVFQSIRDGLIVKEDDIHVILQRIEGQKKSNKSRKERRQTFFALLPYLRFDSKLMQYIIRKDAIMTRIIRMIQKTSYAYTNH